MARLLALMLTAAPSLADYQAISEKAADGRTLDHLVGTMADNEFQRLEALYKTNPDAFLFLGSVPAFSPAQAQVVASFKGQVLVLGVTVLDGPTAAALAAWPGKNILFTDLETLEPEAAASLAKWKGLWLFLDRVKTLSAPAAKSLAGFKGLLISLRGQTHVDPAAAKELAAFKGSVAIKLNRAPQGGRVAGSARDQLIVLVKAIRAGDVGPVRTYLEGGGDPEFGEKGNTLLMEAAYVKQPAIVKLLLEAKANPNAVSLSGETPLSFALQDDMFGKKTDTARRTEIVTALLAKGAQVNPAKKSAPTRDDALMFSTPLQRAAELGEEGLVKLLLSKGADPNGSDYHGRGALDSALAKAQLGVAKQLLAAGAKRPARQGTLVWLVDQGASDTTMFEYRAKSEGKPLDTKELTRRRTNWSSLIDLVVKAGVDPKELDDRGRSILEAAINGGDTVLLEKVIALGAQVNQPFKSGVLPLHYCAGLRRMEEPGLIPVAKVLLARGAKKAATDAAGKTAAQVAAERNAPGLARLLEP